jgi:hypothetical protein
VGGLWHLAGKLAPRISSTREVVVQGALHDRTSPTEDRRPLILLDLYLALYAVFGARSLGLISDLFEGYRPKEVMSLYAARLFLNPFSAVFAPCCCGGS